MKDDVMKVLVETEGEHDGARKSEYVRMPFITLNHYPEAEVVVFLIVDKDADESVSMLAGRRRTVYNCEMAVGLLEGALTAMRNQLELAQKDEASRKAGAN